MNSDVLTTPVADADFVTGSSIASAVAELAAGHVVHGGQSYSGLLQVLDAACTGFDKSSSAGAGSSASRRVPVNVTALDLQVKVSRDLRRMVAGDAALDDIASLVVVPGVSPVWRRPDGGYVVILGAEHPRESETLSGLLRRWAAAVDLREALTGALPAAASLALLWEAAWAIKDLVDPPVSVEVTRPCPVCQQRGVRLIYRPDTIAVAQAKCTSCEEVLATGTSALKVLAARL